jgi:kinesin family protein 6/9
MSSKQQNKRKGIDIFLRIRPSKKASSNWKITEEKKVSFDVPINDETTSRNKQAAHSFQFNHVLPMNAKQDEVFALVAAAPVTSVLNGFNATIFAYGQTGSGKTWTITGGPERYVDRGIIPRALTMIFKCTLATWKYTITLAMTYLIHHMKQKDWKIYQE